MHLVLTGATGLIGSGVLDAMLHDSAITKISILSRRPVKMAEDAKDPRVNVILHKDFETYNDALLSRLSDAAGCVWALGISQTVVGKEEYIKITKDYTLAAANAFPRLRQSSDPDSSKPPFRFIYVSGAGTTLKPGHFTPFFGRVKGETELALASIVDDSNGRFLAHSLRAASIDSSRHETVRKYGPQHTLMQRTSYAVMGPVTRAMAKDFWSPTGPLGEFLMQLAMGREEWTVGKEGSGTMKTIRLQELPTAERVGRGGMLIMENAALRTAMGL